MIFSTSGWNAGPLWLAPPRHDREPIGLALIQCPSKDPNILTFAPGFGKSLALTINL